MPIALVAGLAFNYCGLIMESSLITQGLDLLLYGMGTVFTFLTLLVGITAAMSGLVNRLVTEDIDQHRGRK